MDDGLAVTTHHEVFPPPRSIEFEPLFQGEANEIRGTPFRLDYKRYDELERQRRLVWVVARENFNDEAVGYCGGYIFRDLHWDETVAAGDLWYVMPVFRGKGVGRFLLEHRDELLRDLGASKVYEHLAPHYNHPKLLADSGYETWGHRWMKKL